MLSSKFQGTRSMAQTESSDPRSASDIEQQNAVLFPAASEEVWSSLHAPEGRVAYLQEISDSYHRIVTEFYDSANLGGRRYRALTDSNKRWRWTLIIVAGGVAVLNLIAALGVGEEDSQILGNTVLRYVSLTAAIAATVLAVLGRLETFSNSLAQAKGFRESRDLFLDAARAFEGLWRSHVRPYQSEPTACVNAAELNRRIIEKDCELREKFHDLTDPGAS